MEEQKLIEFDVSVLSEEVIEILLLDSTAEPSLFDEIAQKNTHRPTVLRHLLDHPNTPQSTRRFIAEFLDESVPVMPAQHVSETKAEDEKVTEQKKQSLLLRIQKMKVGEKIQLALKGSREIRSVLIRDSVKEVMLSVLQNPKMTESEIEIISKQKTTNEEVLRTISKKKEWLKNYSIVHSLVSNPKTPTGVALQHISSLRLKDLLQIEKNKNISDAVRASAKKLISVRKPS